MIMNYHYGTFTQNVKSELNDSDFNYCLIGILFHGLFAYKKLLKLNVLDSH